MCVILLGLSTVKECLFLLVLCNKAMFVCFCWPSAIKHCLFPPVGPSAVKHCLFVPVGSSAIKHCLFVPVVPPAIKQCLFCY